MKTLTAALLLLFILPLQAAQVTISTPKWWMEGEVTAVAFDLSGRTQYTLFTLENPHRLVVDFRNARYSGSTQQRVANHPLIQQIRGGVRPEGGYRIVLDLARKVSTASYLSSSGQRLVVELSDPGRAPTTLRQAEQRPATPTPPPRAAAPTPPQTVATPAPAPRAAPPAPPPQTVATPASAPRAAPTRRPPSAVASGTRDVVVVIDAGHGGRDAGAQGPNGTSEKDVTLGIARQLAALIEKEEGMSVVMTRNSDTFVRLRERMQIARDANADLFISIHANGYTSSRVRGASVYILSSGGASSEAARMLAEKENSAESIGTIELHSRDKDLQAVLIDLSQSATIQESHDVAGRVLKSLGSLGRIQFSSVQRAGFAVLRSPDVPSILVETAFITNPEEERKLSSREYQRNYAAAILAGARDYFYSNPPPGTLIAAKARRDRTLAGVSRSESGHAPGS